MICCGLVLHDIEFAPDIVFEIVIVPVEMIFRNIGEDRHIRPEIPGYHPAENC